MSSSSSSCSSPPKVDYEPRKPVVFTLFEHLTALLSHHSQLRKGNKTQIRAEVREREKCAQAAWYDLRGCPMSHERQGKHTRLVEETPLHADQDYDESCASCLKNGEAEAVSLAPPAGFVLETDQEVRLLRQAWLKSSRAVVEAEKAATAKRSIGATTLVAVVAHAVLRAEREAWFTYAAVMFEHVRPAVYKPRGERSGFHADFVRQLSEFHDDQQKRCGARMPGIWCITHAKLGHVVPIFGGVECYARYRECIVCPREKQIC